MLTKIITLIVLTRAVRGNILESQSNYQKPILERNNIINKGVWVRNKLQDNLFDRASAGNFIFRENSLDVENLLQNNFDPFGTTYMEDAPSVTNYIKRAKRALRRIREQRLRRSLKNCIGKGCKTFIIEDQEEVRENPVKQDDKDITSVFNDYPYEVAILMNNNKREINIPENYTINLDNDINQNSNNLSKINEITHKPELSIETDFKENNETIAKNITSPKRSKKYDFESEIIKKFEFEEDMNRTQVNNLQSENKPVNRNIFDKDNTVWHQNAPIPNVNVYKVVPKEPQKSKPVTERGLIKVISMLTKTFKKIMKQHNEIKEIRERITDVNDQFHKNADAITTKFQDFDVKYLYLLKFYEKLKVFDARLATKQEYFKNKEREMTNNFKEFENQQKKFLQQQRQFYNIQKLMLAQNEKINAKQNVIAKTQSEISHRQNNFARILKKAKQLYLESKNPTAKVSSNVIKPFQNLKPAVLKPQISTTTPSTESVKINLFSIPTSNKIENQDDMIIKEKDDQTIDDLVYKYYFNNTFIDNVMKNNVLTSLMGISNNPGLPRNIKSKRNQLETTILLPVYENNNSDAMSKNRERRWINHHSRHRGKRRERGKGGPATIINATDGKPFKNKVVNNSPVVAETSTLKAEGDIKIHNDPFLSMATNFCNEIRQNVNSQMLTWCVEKALRKLRYLDMNNISTLAIEVPMIAVPTTTLKSKPWRVHKHRDHTKQKPKKNTKLEPLITKLYTKGNIELTTVKTEPSTASTATVPVTKTTTVTASPSTKPPTSSTPATTKLAPVTQTENATNPLEAKAFFPRNEELESNLKQYDIKPDIEGNVYFEGSVHASEIINSDNDSQGMDDLMPGLESNSRIDMDPLAFDLQAQRRAIVRKLNEKIKMSLG